ncbi:hypothetical protein ERO13_A12G046300v2 [Gossypium hirsutum]|uniref:Glucan endo-1,3-beta-glucosidase 13 isoform X1 n=5 Tax=Gossypium TaxID=3633 RepID=A0A1U8LLI9_GOSHI|nr:glucan endo-1,3-beta-glucosidase 13 isoform X1 [Gossypium hirsutum]KAB2051310.1 hypothetical protein ES319_A12G047000v1 [Gossypium barbadense]TYG88796.1 hypothetical protein ES288_A12G049600v1 [Gossypium darwinii]TYH94563.1 hypothetical protein ES332_A12G049400v1 [Gossypium tomentosum]TYJ03748.1 hypothetical protein E1A91_A12G048800v1 [Gossypium mustelinum]KAG4168790.1 hypothetical protein ERO13_A12G046300v2 [Gossypium hirsutum]
MTKVALVFKCSLLLMTCCFLVSTMETSVQDKADAGIPVTTLSPPEGNTTFLDGTTWCVALAGVSQIDLQNALDWACGLGMSDCGAIQEGGKCYEPDTLLSHASYAFNNYYQQNGNSDIACNFGGTATLTKNNPSYGKCLYAAPGSDRSATPPLSKHKSSFLWWEIVGILLLLYKGS